MMIILIVAAATAAGTPVAATKPASNAPKVRCKRQLETGSLARYVSVCRTEVDWESHRIDARARARELQNGINNIPDGS